MSMSTPSSSPRSSITSSSSFVSLSEPSQQRIEGLIQRVEKIQRLIEETQQRIGVIGNDPLTRQNTDIQRILGILNDKLVFLNREKDRITGEIENFIQLLNEYQILEEGIQKLSPP